MKRIFYDDVDYRLKGWRKLERLIDKVIGNEKMISGDLNFILTTDESLLEINRKFLEHDYFTDVISFNYNNDNIVNGEIYISVDRIRENAQNYKVSFKNELVRVIVHGVLHLTGYEDKTMVEKSRMTEMEDYWLEMFNNEVNGI